MSKFRIPADEFRALPIPYANLDGSRPKLGNCYVRVTDLPKELGDWLKVNPRVPKTNQKDLLVGPVGRGIVSTLKDDPAMMVLKNNGITLLADKAEFSKQPGGQGVLEFEFSDPARHGVANGGHTLAAIRQVIDDDGDNPSEAYVRLHVLENLDQSLIPEIAEGLNRSLQVDDKSLENLQGTFEEIKTALAGKPGSDEVAYRQGDQKPVDVQFILALMGMMDLDEYPDRKAYPYVLFGQPKSVLQKFSAERVKLNPGYKRILPQLHDILVLSDQVQKGLVAEMGKYKVKKTKSSNRVASAPHKNRRGYFADIVVGGWIPQGWLYPAVGAFRANIDRDAWSAGEFKWLMDPQLLLDQTIAEICDVIKQEHEANKEKPAEVGRKEAAYRGCYGAVMMELASRGLLTN